MMIFGAITRLALSALFFGKSVTVNKRKIKCRPKKIKSVPATT